MIEKIIFYFLAALTVIPAIFVVTVRNIFHAALFLILSLLGVGGLYAMCAADFIFAVQLLVYAGGIMVILLFVVLLSGKPSDWAGAAANEKAWLAGLLSLFLAIVIGTSIYFWPVQIQISTPMLSTPQLGSLLLKEMLIPFEVISLVLVAGLIGALYFSSKRPS